MKTRNIIFIVLGIILVGLIIITLFFVPSMLSAFGATSFPTHVWTEAESRCSCLPESRFFGELSSNGIKYKSKVNVKIAESQSQAFNLRDDNSFIFDIGLRCSDEKESNSDIGDGVPAQEKCSGLLDCDFGFTREDWELRGDECFVEPRCIEGNDRCVGINFQVCENGDWSDEGITIGECNVGCFVDSDCEERILSSFCTVSGLSTRIVAPSCLSNRCSDVATTNIETCEFGCDVIDEESQCLEAKPIFQDPLFLTISGIIILLAIVGIVFFFIRRRR